MIIQDKRGNNINKLAKMMGLSNADIVDKLNIIYKGKLKFGISGIYSSDSIRVNSIECDAVKIVLPDVEGYSLPDLFFSVDIIDHEVDAVEIPRSVKSVDLARLMWLGSIKRLFLHDTTEVTGWDDDKFKSLFNGHALEMIVILSDTGKHKVYHISKKRA